MTNPYSYQDRRVVVTGAATGVGAALIELLAELDVAHVTVLDVKAPSGPHDTFLQTDLSDARAVRDVIRAIDGPVHALFNNAGVADTQPPRTVLSVNYLALRTLSEGLLDSIPDAGAIVNTASTAGGQWPAHLEQINELLDIDGWDAALEWTDTHLLGLGVAPYFFSKELVQVYTMRSSRPTIRRGVRTNSVCPSPIDTPLLADFRVSMTDKLIDWNITETNGRLVTAREVATVLAFLGSPAAAYVNGVNLNVDAGFNAAMTTGQVDFSGLA
ncbi:MAG: short-chain dehydrogenase/reductase [Actinomycetia bacterium]|nr:short-chain dehydrogenase/reductase [Actinomycetes bacterium]